MNRHHRILTDNILEQIRVVRDGETFAIIRKHRPVKETVVIILSEKEMKDLIEFAKEEGIC